MSPFDPLRGQASLKWYCVHTRPKKEAYIVDYCQTQLGLECFYPILRQYRTIRRVRRLVTGPLFPRYFFCCFDLSTSYRAVRYAPDVIDLVHAGSAPAIVDGALIKELKVWASPAENIITTESSLQIGDQVEITDGPMRGIPATILQTSDDRDRVAILLSVLQCGAQMIVRRSQIKRAT